MTSIREIATTAIKATSGITDIIGEDDAARLYQYSSMGDPEVRPFLVMKLMEAHEHEGWRAGPVWQPMQIWAHNEPGDYDLIDRLLDLVKVAFLAVPSQTGLVEVRYSTTSQDLEDDQLGTILRYSTFRWTLA